MSTLAAALVAWLVSLPLVAFHFEQLNTWAVLGSIVLAPFVFAALVAGLFKVVLSLLLPMLAEPLAEMAAFFVRLMRLTVDELARLPWSDVPLPAPSIGLMALCYLALVLALCPWMRPSFRWLTRGALAASLLAVFILPFSLGAASPTGNASDTAGECRITLLAVGAGQCAVIEPPGGRVVLVDAGSQSMSDPLRRAIAPFLRHRGITGIDTVVITHANFDHYSAAAEVVENYAVREVISGPRFAEQAALFPPGAAVLRALESLDRPVRVVTRGQRIPLARDTTLSVIHPDEHESFAPNDGSLVLRLEHAGTRVLFTGDIQDAAMQALLAEHADELPADVLLAPHHGSAEPSTPAFLKAVAPQLIIASNDRTLSGKQRQFDRLVGGTPMLRTHSSGAITIRIARDGRWTVRTHLAAER
jgi:competence protein ComEC